MGSGQFEPVGNAGCTVWRRSWRSERFASYQDRCDWHQDSPGRRPCQPRKCYLHGCSDHSTSSLGKRHAEYHHGGSLFDDLLQRVSWWSDLQTPSCGSSPDQINRRVLRSRASRSCNRCCEQADELSVWSDSHSRNEHCWQACAQMYRYRQGFFTTIAIGNNGGIAGPQRRGGFTGAGLEGFSGQGTSGFAGQGDLAGLGGGGFTNQEPAAAAAGQRASPVAARDYKAGSSGWCNSCSSFGTWKNS